MEESLDSPGYGGFLALRFLRFIFTRGDISFEILIIFACKGIIGDSRILPIESSDSSTINKLAHNEEISKISRV